MKRAFLTLVLAAGAISANAGEHHHAKPSPTAEESEESELDTIYGALKAGQRITLGNALVFARRSDFDQYEAAWKAGNLIGLQALIDFCQEHHLFYREMGKTSGKWMDQVVETVDGEAVEFSWEGSDWWVGRDMIQTVDGKDVTD
jgi:hypothetical protein